MKEYICPECKHNLQQQKTKLICCQCGREYPVLENIPVFNRVVADYKRTALKHEEKYNHLLQEAKENDWFHALMEIYPDERESVVSYAVNKKKSDFLFLLPLHNEANVLDLGCGLGPVTHALAQSVKKVYAIDTLLEQVQFTSIRLHQEGHENVRFACGGDDCQLPYHDKYFDVVILNAVLQWVGLSSSEQNPMVAQKKILSEIKRVLKDDGVLYLSVPNRFAMGYLFGKPDEHSFGFRFATIFPYFVSNYFVRARTGRNYTGRCYSYFEYRRLLQEIGFHDISFYLLFPDFRKTEFIIPSEFLSNSGDFTKRLIKKIYAKRGPVDWAMRILPMNFIKYFVYHYGIICRKRKE